MLRAVVFIGLLALQPSYQATVTEAGTVVVESATFTGVIFPAEAAEAQRVALIAGKFTEEGYWTPAIEDIVALEAQLEPFLRERAEAYYPRIVAELPAYLRQYAGIVDDGRQVVFASFSCNSEGLDWQQTFMAILDGGDCYFEVEYDPETGAFVRFSVHGEA